MNKKVLQEYENLYMKYDNSNESFDYVVFLDLYEFYLAMFVSEVPNYDQYYMDLDYLSKIVGGFSYYQNSIFEDGFVNDDDLSQFISSNNVRLSESLDLSYEDTPIEDNIFKITSTCCDSIINLGIAEEAQLLIREMFSNSYKISSTLQKYNGNYKGM